MDLAELDAGFDPNPQLQQNPGVRAHFYSVPCRDQVASIEAGRPIFKDSDFVRITVAGDRNTIIERPATAQDRARYAVKYGQYKANQEQVSVGFPLSEWPGVTRSQVEELRFFKLHTVEDLAAVSDSNGQKFHAFLALREKAKNYLLALEKNAPLEKMQSELKERDDKIELLMQNQEAMAAEMKALRAKKVK